MTTTMAAEAPALRLAEKLADLLDEKDNQDLEYKDFDFKADALEAGEFDGFASVFGNVDQHRDIVEPGFFAKTLKETGGRVPILWQHDRHEPIGVSLKLEETDTGLDAVGKLVLGVQRAREAHELLLEKAIKGLSIGYTVVKHSFDENTGIRRLMEGKLHEFSLVTFAANTRASVRRVKSGEIDELAGLLLELKHHDPVHFKALLAKAEPETSTRTDREAAAMRLEPAIKATLGDFTDLLNAKNGDQNDE